MKQFHSLVFLSLILVVIPYLVTACGVNNATPPHEEFPFELMLSKAELPLGWVQEDGYFHNSLGKLTYIVDYYDEVGVSEYHFFHQIDVYLTSSDAAKGFELDKKITLHDLWQPETNYSFVPLSQDDQVFFAHDTVIDDEQTIYVYSCVQLHKNLVVFLTFTSNDQYITLSKFFKVLTQLDAKLQTYQPPE